MSVRISSQLLLGVILTVPVLAQNGARIVTENKYDGIGRIIETQTRCEGYSDILSQTHFKYDEYSNVIEETAHASAALIGPCETISSEMQALTIRRTFDSVCVNKVKTQIDPRGTTVFENTYDPSSCLLKETKNSANVRQRFDYSNRGQLVREQILDPGGRVLQSTTYAYTPKGELAQTTIQDLEQQQNIVVTYTYDDVGNLTSITDQYGNTTTATYDLLRRQKELTNPRAGMEVYTYTPQGLLTQVEKRPE